MSTVRLFISLPTPPAVKAGIAEVATALRQTGADARWEAVEKMHTTLKFLGDTPADLVPALGDALLRAAAVSPPIPAVYRAVGAFPSLRRPRVLWIGVDDPSGALAALHGVLEEELSRLGIARDDRPFHPHVTLGRLRSDRNLTRLLATLESLTLDPQPVHLHDAQLVKSELKPHGSVHSTLRTAAFVGNQLQRG